MGFVKLSGMPTPPKTRVSSVQNMKGGLNIHDLAWQIQADQSPEMKNMWWRDGVLQSRPGITAYNNGMIVGVSSTSNPNFGSIPSHARPYHGWYVLVNPSAEAQGGFTLIAADDLQYYAHVSLPDGSGGSKTITHGGSFFEYGGVLYYKAEGIYVRLNVSEEVDAAVGLNLLQAEEVEGYIPTTYMNARPSNFDYTNTTEFYPSGHSFGGGDAYQPVNRLTPWRRITYSIRTEDRFLYIPEPVDNTLAADKVIVIEYLCKDGSWAVFGDWGLAYMDGTEGNVCVQKHQTWIEIGRHTAEYPVGLYEALKGEETLEAHNNLRVTYKASTEEGSSAQTVVNSLMSCDLAVVYGGGAGLCVVMAGCSSQPNAYFWSGNTNVAMDPTYFPVENYNLAGDVSDPITAFGKQQNMLVIFQERQIGRCAFGTTEIDGRIFVTMDYTVVNPQIGCDVPNSVQLVENNLVFANTKSGVMFIKDTSAAYENNIVNISRNVEASRSAPGVLLDIGSSPRSVTSIDDGKRYWLCANDHAWLWDYSLGGSINDAKSLSWFYFDSMKTPGCWLGLDREIPAYIGIDGYLRKFETTTTDAADETTGLWSVRGGDFEKVLALPIQDFNTYEVLKNVDKAIFVVKSSGDSSIDIEYETDYGTRKDLTPIRTYGARTWLPRDLTKGRSLVFTKFAVTAVRKPRCLHVRHFLVRLRNSARSEAVSFISAQIYFTLQGADR